MMRKKLKGKKSRNLFKATSDRIHVKNKNRARIMRGGTRL